MGVDRSLISMGVDSYEYIGIDASIHSIAIQCRALRICNHTFTHRYGYRQRA